MPTIRDRAFQLFWRTQRPLTLGVRGVVTNSDGQVLLVRHTYTPGWHFPGGGVEKRETTQEALRRELQEEASIEVTGGLNLVSVHSNHRSFPNDHVLVFAVAGWSQAVFKPSREIAEIAFVDPLSPPDDVSGGTQRRLNEMFGGAALSEQW